MILPCLTLSNISYISRAKWSNPGKGVAPSPTPRCSSYWERSLLVTLDYGHQLLLYFNNNKISYKQITERRLRKIRNIGINWLPASCDQLLDKNSKMSTFFAAKDNFRQSPILRTMILRSIYQVITSNKIYGYCNYHYILMSIIERK